MPVGPKATDDIRSVCIVAFVLLPPLRRHGSDVHRIGIQSDHSSFWSFSCTLSGISWELVALDQWFSTEVRLNLRVPWATARGSGGG